MSTYDDASLIIPVSPGYKVGEIYALKPIDGTGDLVFARNSVANEENTSGLINGVAIDTPRFNHRDGVECPSLLVEKQSINLVTYPLTFSDASWVKFGATVTGGQSSPSVDYPTSAFKLTEDSSTAIHGMFMTTSVVGNDYSSTFHVKEDTRRYVSIVCSDNTRYLGQITFDTRDGGVTNTYLFSGVTETHKVVTLGNGWFSMSVAFTFASFNTLYYNRLFLEDSATPSTVPANTYTGDGTSGVYVYGAQLEQSLYPTSFIYDGTEGSTTTRIKDEFSKGGLTSLIDSTAGVLFLEIPPTSFLTNTKYITLNNGSATDRVVIRFDYLSGNILFFVSVISVASTVKTVAVDFSVTNKIAYNFEANRFVSYVNGVKTSTDLYGIVPVANTFTTISSNQGNGTLYFEGNINSLIVIKGSQTDAYLAALTT